MGACLLCLGWGGGLPAKSAWLDTTNPDYRQILSQYAIYNRAAGDEPAVPEDAEDRVPGKSSGDAAGVGGVGGRRVGYFAILVPRIW